MEDKPCQSCSIPISENEEFGTNADGSRNDDYCAYCYQGGEFTQPDITMQEMASLIIGFIAKEGKMSEEEAEKIALSTLPTLKRWAAA